MVIAKDIHPIVSVCVQTFNQEKYIQSCIDSILAQKTDFAFEIILGEDDSEDGTREICRKYAEDYPQKIKLFLRNRKDVIEIDGSPTGRFNFIQNFNACKGEYVAMCEGDDYWTDRLKMQKQYDFLKMNPNFSICFHEVEVLNERVGLLKKDMITRTVPDVTTIDDLAKGNFIHTVSVMFRKDFVLPDWYTKPFNGDWSLYMICVADRKIKKLDETMAVYRVHKGGIWSEISRQNRIKRTILTQKVVFENLNLKSNTAKILSGQIQFLERKLLDTNPQQKLINFLKKYVKAFLNSE